MKPLALSNASQVFRPAGRVDAPLMSAARGVNRTGSLNPGGANDHLRPRASKLRVEPASADLTSSAKVVRPVASGGSR